MARMKKKARTKRLLVLVAILLIAAVAAVASVPSAARWYVQDTVLPAVGRRLGRDVSARVVKVEWGRALLQGVVLSSQQDAPGQPMVSIPKVTVHFDPWDVLDGEVTLILVEVDRPAVRLLRKADGTSNYLDLLARQGAAGASSSSPRARLKDLVVRSGTISVEDRKMRVLLSARSFDGRLKPGVESRLQLYTVSIKSPRLPSEVMFTRVTASGSRRQPHVGLAGGQLRLLKGLELTGIRGALQPDPVTNKISIRLVGSYGGAVAELWEAQGWVGMDLGRGSLRMKATRFSLGRIASYLTRTPVIMPQQTLVDGELALALTDGVLQADGGFEMSRLNLFHPALARTPVLDLSGKARARCRVDLGKSRVDLQELVITSRGVKVQLDGSYDGSADKPVVEVGLKVPQIPCDEVRRAFPPSLVPNLKDFALRGKFSLDLRSRIDFARLDRLTLTGKVGIKRCKVLRAPQWASAERLNEQFEQQVEVTPGNRLAFIVGPDSENYTPYDEISPVMVHALLTTEDGGFFRHKGFITSQFRKALGRNLKKGGFRLGASTITMQMVKNVLLTSEKTLSRKLQEMFITWYLEQNLTKERILEIYLNVIELGPGIYGIGAATRHYFGKVPRDITPLEAAFIATLLPSPKRRYVQYCHGKPTPKWDKYVRRVLRRMGQRGYCSDVALSAAEGQQLTFVRDMEALSEEDCKKMVKDVMEQWHDEYRLRLRRAIRQAAPHQVGMYIKD